jgi:hypothetical protein
MPRCKRGCVSKSCAAHRERQPLLAASKARLQLPLPQSPRLFIALGSGERVLHFARHPTARRPSASITGFRIPDTRGSLP